MHIQLLFVLIFLLIILWFIYNSKFEKFTNESDTKVLVFVSDTCPHCVSYKTNKHEKVKSDVTENGWDYELINSSPETRDYFEKYNVQFIPACIVVKKRNHKQVRGDININNIKETINEL